MLAAVGLLLASLVVGFGTNLTRALGENNAGICGYSDLMEAAILANNNQTGSIYDCDDFYAATGDDQTFWGGSTGTTGTATDKPKDLDLSNKGISTFAPGRGELDGFVKGSRVDLRGNGLTTADLDVSEALKTWVSTTVENDETTEFGKSVNGEGTEHVPGLTFLLDGGSTSANGLASPTYTVTEGGIVWITFQYGSPHADFAKVSERDGGNWARVTVTVDHDRASDDETSVVSIMLNSKDAAGTLYAVPFLFPDDIVIEKDKDYDIEIVDTAMVGVGRFEDAQGTGTSTTFTAGEFKGSLDRNADEAEITVIDNDTPPVLVADRQDDAADAIANAWAEQVNSANNNATKSKKKMSIGDIAAIGTLIIGKNNTVANNGDPISSLSPADLSGLTGLADTPTGAVNNNLVYALNLADNDLTELPSGLFADVGTDSKGDLSTGINIKGNDGPDGSGFMLSNLGAVGNELKAGQYLAVDTAKDDSSGSGFLNASYEGTEGGVLVFDVNIKVGDVGADKSAGIQFISTAGDSGSLAKDDKTDKDVNSATINLEKLAVGQYRIAIGLPENTKESGDNTLTALFGRAAQTENGTAIANLTSILSVAPVTIRDASYMAPAPAPTSSFDSVVVTGNEFVEAPGNEDLKHNISNLAVTMGGNALNANFLDVYNMTGGLERWGYPTSEVVEIESGALSQFYQRGVLDFHDVGAGYLVERRLAWDYVGGGLGGSTDQGVEAAPDSAPAGGEQVGAFGHYVANVDADGNATGFLDFFNRLGGVDAFGFPKTEAREDTGADGMLLDPGSVTGFTRQYFQAAVFQLAEDGTVQLTLLGDTLRGLLVPGFADEAAFGAASALSVGDSISPDVIS